MAVDGGVTQAFFPEGGLSRDGALRTPKIGLLDYMLRAFDPAGARDLVFVPVGLNLDRTLEDRTLLRDLEPETPKAGLAATAATTLRFLGHHALLLASNRWHRFGYACVNFGAPISLKAWLAGRAVDLPRLGKEARLAQAKELAADLMGAVGRVIPVLPVPLLASVLAREPERRFTPLELKAEALALLSRLEAAGAPVYVPRRDRDYAIDFGLKSLASATSSSRRAGSCRRTPTTSRSSATTRSRSHTSPARRKATPSAIRPVGSLGLQVRRADEPRMVEARVDAREAARQRRRKERPEAPRGDPVADVADVPVRRLPPSLVEAREVDRTREGAEGPLAGGAVVVLEIADDELAKRAIDRSPEPEAA